MEVNEIKEKELAKEVSKLTGRVIEIAKKSNEASKLVRRVVNTIVGTGPEEDCMKEKSAPSGLVEESNERLVVIKSSLEEIMKQISRL